jgi:glycosyltransferase involved in cell wall biosynthesis
MAMLEVIVSTYNNPQALHWALLALSVQSTQEFCVCVADDGSGPETRSVVDQWLRFWGQQKLRHVWHPDEGFAKNRILNKAIASSTSSYLIFIDGDCLTSPHFVAQHIRLRQAGWFLSGGLLRMPWSVNPHLSDETVRSGQVFTWDWLRRHGCRSSLGNYLKIGRCSPAIARLAERVAPLKRVWNGSNSSGWRADIVKVNGFDETMVYGSEDVEMGMRLLNNGLRVRLTHYSAPILHIEHKRGYIDALKKAQNKSYAQMVKRKGQTWTANGLVKSEHSLEIKT